MKINTIINPIHEYINGTTQFNFKHTVSRASQSDLEQMKSEGQILDPTKVKGVKVTITDLYKSVTRNR